MSETPGQAIELFYCYAREDKALRDELEIHLSLLRRQYHLINWNDYEILAGDEWEEAIDTHLNTADLILLLISPHFMASEYCYGKEMAKALERQRAKTCRVIPILLRPTDWENAPFSRLQLLPTGAKAVTTWPDHDIPFSEVTREIRKVIEELLIELRTKEQWLEEGDKLYNQGRDEKALKAYERAIRLDPDLALAHNKKGNALYNLERYEEALGAYDEAIRLDPNATILYGNKGIILGHLKRYEEALDAYEQVIRLDPNNADARTNIKKLRKHLRGQRLLKGLVIKAKPE